MYCKTEVNKLKMNYDITYTYQREQVDNKFVVLVIFIKILNCKKSLMIFYLFWQYILEIFPTKNFQLNW